jgi:hypothetical protein
LICFLPPMLGWRMMPRSETLTMNANLPPRQGELAPPEAEQSGEAPSTKDGLPLRPSSDLGVLGRQLRSAVRSADRPGVPERDRLRYRAYVLRLAHDVWKGAADKNPSAARTAVGVIRGALAEAFRSSPGRPVVEWLSTTAALLSLFATTPGETAPWSLAEGRASSGDGSDACDDREMLAALDHLCRTTLKDLHRRKIEAPADALAHLTELRRRSHLDETMERIIEAVRDFMRVGEAALRPMRLERRVLESPEIVAVLRVLLRRRGVYLSVQEIEQGLAALGERPTGLHGLHDVGKLLVELEALELVYGNIGADERGQRIPFYRLSEPAAKIVKRLENTARMAATADRRGVSYNVRQFCNGQVMSEADRLLPPPDSYRPSAPVAEDRPEDANVLLRKRLRNLPLGPIDY